MKEKLTKNLGLKVVAVLFAACLWMISININDPYQSKDYSVVVQMQNMNKMTGAGKYIEVVDETDEITVRVRGSRSVMENFNVSNISATADLSELNADNQVPIKLSVVKTSGSKIESIRSGSTHVSVKIEDIRKVQKRIEVVTKNSPGEGYVLGKTSTEQNALSITGPESLVNQVERAVVSFDLSGATEDVSMLLPIELYDGEGERMNDSRLSVSIKEVQCVATVLAVKEVPIVTEVKGKAAEGYGFTGEIILEPNTVLIGARSSLLKNISQIMLGDGVDIQDAQADVERVVDIRRYLPDNTILADSDFDGRITVKAVIEKEIDKTIERKPEDIEIRNLPETAEAVISSEAESLELVLTGYESAMSELKDRELVVWVDIGEYMEARNLEELEEGTYELKAMCELPENIAIKEALTLEIEVTLK